MKSLIFRTMLFLVALGGISACATIANGTQQTVSFNSSPEGATVSLDGRVLGKTPLSVMLDKESDQMFQFKLEGYKPYERKLNVEVSGWFFGNIIIGGVLGSTTDAASGGMYEYSPNEYMVVLEKVEANGINGSSSRSAMEKLREFVVVNHALLRQEIANGEGDTLNALYDLLSISNTERDNALKDIRRVADVNASAPAFANALVEKFAE